MSFYTTINCMDGRVQFPVLNYLMERFGVESVYELERKMCSLMIDQLQQKAA